MKNKIPACLLLLNMDLIPNSENGYPMISEEEKTLLISSLTKLQEEREMPILYSLYSDSHTKKSWQKGIHIYNGLAHFLPMNKHVCRALNLGLNLYDPYHKMNGFSLEEIYPEYEITKTIYLMGDDKVALQSPTKEDRDFTYIKGNSILDITQNIMGQKSRKREKNEL